MQAGQNLVHYAVYTFSNKCSFYFFLKEIFFHMIFFSKFKGMFLQNRSGSSWCSLRVALCPPPRSLAGAVPLALALRFRCGSVWRRPAAGREASSIVSYRIVFSIGTCITVKPGARWSGGVCPGSRAGVWRWRNNRTPVLQECLCGIKGIYLTMKQGNKCAYIEQCEDVSYRYSTSKGRASPKPKKEKI